MFWQTASISQYVKQSLCSSFPIDLSRDVCSIGSICLACQLVIPQGCVERVMEVWMSVEMI